MKITDKMIPDWIARNYERFGQDIDGQWWAHVGSTVLRFPTVRKAIAAAIRAERRGGEDK